VLTAVLMSAQLQAQCPPADVSGDNQVMIGEVIAVVQLALNGCPAASCTCCACDSGGGGIACGTGDLNCDECIALGGTAAADCSVCGNSWAWTIPNSATCQLAPARRPPARRPCRKRGVSFGGRAPRTTDRSLSLPLSAGVRWGGGPIRTAVGSVQLGMFRLQRPVAGWDSHPLEIAVFARHTSSSGLSAELEELTEHPVSDPPRRAAHGPCSRTPPRARRSNGPPAGVTGPHTGDQRLARAQPCGARAVRQPGRGAGGGRAVGPPGAPG